MAYLSVPDAAPWPLRTHNPSDHRPAASRHARPNSEGPLPARSRRRRPRPWETARAETESGEASPIVNVERDRLLTLLGCCLELDAGV